MVLNEMYSNGSTVLSAQKNPKNEITPIAATNAIRIIMEMIWEK